MNPLTESERAQVADKIIKYANEHGMWDTIEFIVKRWSENNPEQMDELKEKIAEEKSLLQNRFGNNELSRKGNMSMRRVLEVPGDIWNLVNLLFSVEKKEYKGGEKQFWRDFGKRFPFFKIGE